MNKPMKHGYWGTTVDMQEMLDKIAAIGPELEKNAPEDEKRGELSPRPSPFCSRSVSPTSSPRKSLAAPRCARRRCSSCSRP